MISKRYIEKSFLFVSVLVAFFLFSGGVSAQETAGSVAGTIRDGSGAPVAGATVVAVHVPSGTRYAAMSGSDGRYVLPGLRVGGPYEIKVTFIGLLSQTKDNVQVNLGGTLTADFLLADNAKRLSEVVVRAARGAPKVNSYGAGTNISRVNIQNMPSVSRSIQDMTRLTPQGSRDNSFGGSNFRYNNVTVDGAINNDAIGFSPSLGGITGTSGMPGSSTRTNPISIDAIQDIQVYLAPYDVKIGNFTGGSINAVTRSGTNAVTGSAYAYGRNALLTGPNNAGDKKRLPNTFYEYQTGIRVGLPLIKNKLFLFTNEEITRRQDPLILTASSPDESQVLTANDAYRIDTTTRKRYNFNVGTAGGYFIYSQSIKFFNRLDYNLNDHNQFTLRNNTIFSRSTNLERDQQNFRFSSIDYLQKNNQTSTVFEWKDRISMHLANSFIAGYTNIHDFREPTSDPTFPQVQITGATPGTTIFLGTDREASIFNFRQKTLEFTDNFTWYSGRNTVLFGTHNELYSIDYGFVNAWNGRVEYPSVQSYLDGLPSRARGSYAVGNDDRGYLLSHPSAKFNVNLYSGYAQDEIQITDNFKITPGLRVDVADVPHKQILSDKITNIAKNIDPTANTTFTTTPLYKITEDYLGRLQVSPRIGFRYESKEVKNLVLRGGLGAFTSRIPFAWIGYAFYNNGNTFGAFDKRADVTGVLNNGIDPIAARNANGIQGFVLKSPTAPQTQVDVIDNKFTMPKVLRGSLAVDYIDQSGFKYTVEGIYTKTIKDVKFQQVNVKDQPTYAIYDSATRRQPYYQAGSINADLANAYEISNTSQGSRYSISGTVSKNFPFGLDFTISYTYAVAKDISNGIRNSPESNFQLNQALSPNNPQLANSNFDIRHRIISNVSYHRSWNDDMASFVNLFFSSQSGSPFTYGFINSNNQGLGQQVSLAYIPRQGETGHFFSDPAQASAFDAYVNGNAYLSSRRGLFTERNEGRTPWNVQADIRFTHEFYFASSVRDHAKQALTITFDVINVTNLINPHWGIQYFSANTYNSTASIGLFDQIPAKSSDNYPLYSFINPGKPYSIDFFNSRYQMQLGVRYSF